MTTPFRPPLFGGTTVGAPMAGTPNDLLAAIVVQLRGWNNAAIPTLLGETSSTTKIWTDIAMGTPAPPWLVIEENDALATTETAGDDGVIHYISDGQFQVDIFATTKVQARTIRRMVVTALNDADLVNSDAAVLLFRVSNDSSPPVPDTTVGAPQAYHAIALFRYIVDRVYT